MPTVSRKNNRTRPLWVGGSEGIKSEFKKKGLPINWDGVGVLYLRWGRSTFKDPEGDVSLMGWGRGCIMKDGRK